MEMHWVTGVEGHALVDHYDLDHLVEFDLQSMRALAKLGAAIFSRCGVAEHLLQNWYKHKIYDVKVNLKKFWHPSEIFV